MSFSSIWSPFPESILRFCFLSEFSAKLHLARSIDCQCFFFVVDSTDNNDIPTGGCNSAGFSDLSRQTL
ncbi:hypothetical protein L596_025392 [Steinernema carpocapsae]|uniref:Uncharacterized protein n=1 Tax=Steinernema carpocapsae TaxID=34508 RepID=A0A4U5M7N1_STECR|nr:hypothetical protein L596_025392 [Steinernema carpocapsae]